MVSLAATEYWKGATRVKRCGGVTQINDFHKGAASPFELF